VPTQLEDLSRASFLGKLLMLPANVRPGWKVIARYKHSSLFGLVICNEEKMFYNIDTRLLLVIVKYLISINKIAKLPSIIPIDCKQIPTLSNANNRSLFKIVTGSSK